MNRLFMIFFILLLPPDTFAGELFLIDKQPQIEKMATQSTADLCLVASGTLSYLNKGSDYDPDVIKSGMLEKFGIDLARVKRTLAFVCQVEREDIIASRAPRLADPEFISRHFEMIKWNPDKSQSALFSDKKPLLKNIPDNKILVTKYYIKLASGSNKKSDQFPYALYALPHDEQDMSLEQANQHKKDLTRYQLTKQQVLTGVIDQKRLATPLVWLSRADLEDSLMQGTVKVTANGHSEFYNVHRNNDIGYKRNLSKYDQQRYWYFKQTSTVLGYGKDANYKIPIQPLVTVAGDLKFFGLGKLLLLTNDGESRLVILADTGGAFEGNQYQLDYLGGFFENWTDYINTYRTFPDYFEARILVLKE